MKTRSLLSLTALFLFSTVAGCLPGSECECETGPFPDAGSAPNTLPDALPQQDAVDPPYCSGGPVSETGGQKRWVWRFDWSYGSYGSGSIEQRCAMLGEDARVEITADVLDGGPTSMTLSAPCASGSLTVELPSESVFHGYAAITVMKNGVRTQVGDKIGPLTGDLHCLRNVSFTIGVSPAQ